MTVYSLAGYKVAVKLRSSKTILVEGLTDKKVLARLFLQHHLDHSVKVNCLIDEISIISDEMLSGKGSKEKIELAAAHLKSLATKLNWLVDREWEGIDLDNPPKEQVTPLTSEWGIRTKGHSIENYWFHEHVFAAYLKMFYGDVLKGEFFCALSNRYSDILRLATAYSFTAKRLGLIKKCQGAIRAIDVQWTKNRYSVLASLNATLAIRQVTADVAVQVVNELSKESISTASPAVLQWLCHGHLGEEMVRACVANLAMEWGSSTETALAIERGEKHHKLSHHADCLATSGNECVEPLYRLVNWAI
jgi:hypothetical protein